MPSLVPVILIALLIFAGCSSPAKEKQAKRDQDRTMIRMTEAEYQRDTLRDQYEKTETELADSNKNLRDAEQQVTLLRKQVQDLQQTIMQLTTQNDKLKSEVARLTSKLPPGSR
jgi:peptidoglycan hydrolase CwlO-like protein